MAWGVGLFGPSVHRPPTGDDATMIDDPHETGTDPSVSVLFVCLGNICRSPLAEGILRHRAGERGLDGRVRADSAGTGAWHVGEPPDRRSVEVASRNGIDLDGRARQVEDEDFDTFDLLVAMDRSNLRKLEGMKRRNGGTADLHLLRDFDPDPGDGEVPDPYYGGPRGFDEVYEMVDRSVDALLDRLEERWEA